MFTPPADSPAIVIRSGFPPKFLHSHRGALRGELRTADVERFDAAGRYVDATVQVAKWLEAFKRGKRRNEERKAY